MVAHGHKLLCKARGASEASVVFVRLARTPFGMAPG